MGKLAFAIITSFIIELSLYLFAGATTENTTLFSLIINPETILSCTQWSCANSLYLGVLILIGVFIGASIIPGSNFFINTYAVYGAFAFILIALSAPIVHLMVFMYGQFDGLISPEFSLVIISLTIGPILIFYIISILEWIRSN